MKKLTANLLLTSLWMGIFSMPSHAATETGTAQANLLGGLSMAFTNDLNFGVILPPAEGDQITMSENTYSPDLNPIEKKWAEVKAKRRKQKCTTEELFEKHTSYVNL